MRSAVIGSVTKLTVADVNNAYFALAIARDVEYERVAVGSHVEHIETIAWPSRNSIVSALRSLRSRSRIWQISTPVSKRVIRRVRRRVAGESAEKREAVMVRVAGDGARGCAPSSR